MDNQLFYYMGLVPPLGILAQWIAWQLRLPSILLLLLFGVILGQFYNPDELLSHLASADHSEVTSDHAGEADNGNDDHEISRPSIQAASAEPNADSVAQKPAANLGPKILFPFVSLCVCVIMFEGGLSLKFHELTESGRPVFRLVSIGAIISMILTAIAAYYILDLNWRIAALLGGLLVVTGPTVVVPLLRHIRPSRRIGAIVKWEGIVIDPVGAILAVLIFEALIHQDGTGSLSTVTLLILAKTAIVAAVLGVSAAFILVQLVKRYWVPDYLHGVFFLASAIAVFALSNLVQHESGLVTVTLLGVLLANQKAASIEHVVHFKENLGVLLVSCLFIVLGSRLDLSALMEVGPRGIIFIIVMILIVRPLSVLISTINADLNLKEKIFLSFLAPRGIVAAAVASVFGLHIMSLAGHQHGADSPITAGLLADAEKLAPITFLVIVATVTVYGLGAAPLARRLGLEDSNPQGILFAGADRWICRIAQAVHKAGFSVALVDTNYRRVSAAKLEHLEAYCASIISEEIEEKINLAGIGRLLAMTPSDEVNALASQEFQHHFGRKNVFQLMPSDAGSGERSSVSEKHRGRIFLEESIHRDELVELFRKGWDVKTTKLSPEFSIESFRSMYGEEALILFVIDAKNVLHVVNSEDQIVVEDDQTIIAIVDPEKTETLDNGRSEESEENENNRPK